MEQRPPRVPKLPWVEEEEEGSGSAPAQETEEVVPFHPPQEDAAVERTQEQQSSRGRFCRTAQFVCKFIKSVRQEEARAMGTGLRAHSEVLRQETSATLLHLLVENGVSRLDQVLECLDLRECSDSVLEIMSKNLQSKYRERRHLALRGVTVASKNPLMAEKMWSLTESLVELLEEKDSDVIRMTILLLRYLFLDNGTPIPSSLALQLAEALLPLFDRDDSQVQLSSMMVFQEMLELLMEDGKKALKSHVLQSLLPLSFHCHDQNQIVAEASRETLHSSARFLKRRDIEQMLQVDQTWRFGEALLAEDTSRAAEQLRRALRYLESPQEPLREAAIRFMGMAGRHLRGQPGELQVICDALEEMAFDSNPAIRNLSIETGFVLRAIQRAPSSTWRKVKDQFLSAWKKRPRLCRRAFLCCWSSVEG